MMYSRLNETNSKRFGYYFDHQLLKNDNGFRKIGTFIFFLVFLALISLVWVPIQEYTQKRNQKVFQKQKERILFSRLIEMEHIHQVISSYNTGLSNEQEIRLAKGIQDFSEEYDLDPYLTLAIIRTESFFNPKAVSFAGAEGLMQILPPTGEQLAGELGFHYQENQILFHPLVNIHMGTRYLSQMLKVFGGNLDLALMAYNRGPNDVALSLEEGREVPMGYANRVWFHYNRLITRKERDVPRILKNFAIIPHPETVPISLVRNRLLASFKVPN